jgi:cation diffusion facilitator CzcD-associated flavoprotein CzcO
LEVLGFISIPGIRSDSDMYTFGYSFKTWDEQKSFADGPSILKYINEAADEYKVRNNIIYQQRAFYNFDTKEKLWTITTENTSTAGKQFTPVSLSLAVAVITIMRYTPIYRSIEV